MIRLTQNDWRIFHRLQRKHKVSTEFLRYNLRNIEKFIWFETWPRIVIRRYAIRKENRVFIIYYRLRRVLFDQLNSKIFKRMRQNIKQWSKRIVAWKKNHFGIKEYVEDSVYVDKSIEQQLETEEENAEATISSNEDVRKQMKEQLEILKNGRRPQPLIASTQQEGISVSTEQESQLFDENACKSHREIQKSDKNNVDNVGNADSSTLIQQQKYSDMGENQEYWQINLESTPEKQITTQENIRPVKQLDTDEKTEKSHTESNLQQTEKLKTGLNFLDMLMCKVSGSTVNSVKTTPPKAKDSLEQIPSSNSAKESSNHYNEHSMDSTDEFLGFEDCERIPGMLMTPIVPHFTKTGKNSIFVSESLNEYMRLNDLETNYSIDEDKSVTKGKIYARDMEGLMTPKTNPPDFDMPAVPENLLKFRTVAERKQYLQKCSKNYRLAIINNEASIYKELQRRMRTQKVKSASQMLAQSANSATSFTRNGWNAASFINTEFNKYYYQLLDVDHGTHKIRLRGARGNNDEFHKAPYVSQVVKPTTECSDYCVDDRIWQYLKPIKTIEEKCRKLNRDTLPSVFKPCPLSHKTFQKPLDDDTAALLLAGGSMAVVRMPTVELEVFPENGKPLHEIAKRYLQYILPNHDISREWAEFSVSTLQQPKTVKEAQQAATNNRKSYTFMIPYLNDRNHILVRRVVDRSEKLDESFEHCIEEKELVPKTDLAFRKNLSLTDEVLQTCADVVSDMINTVAISCSENSFIKIDPDGLDNVYLRKNKMQKISKSDVLDRPLAASSPYNAALCGGNSKKPKKQLSLLNELKRLNATIIDAAVKPENDNKPCSKEYCQMGCICVSLKEPVAMRQHCGKTKCMMECTCKPSSNQSRIMRLETDGRTLTTEDAFMLRRKATARLARMEKEFTSTIVLTENETLLINETNNDKKRRCTKAPKRYEDFADTEEEQRRNSPKKTAMTALDKEKHLEFEIKDFYDPVFVQDSVIDQLKHCTVDLVPLQDMDNIAHWCMVHNLYKCFCKGRAIEGKPMIIEKELNNTTVAHGAEQKIEFDYPASSKAKYTFEKVEKENSVLAEAVKKKKYNNAQENDVDDNDDDEQDDNDEDDDEDEEESNNDDWAKRKRIKLTENKERKSVINAERTNTDEESEETMEYEHSKHKEHPQKPKRNLYDVRKRFYLPRTETCRRHIPTPRRMFLYCNRRRRLNVLKHIKENENERTRLLLNEHIMRSVYYHKNDIENLKKNGTLSLAIEKKEKSNLQVNQMKKTEIQPTTDLHNRKFLLVNEIVDLLEDDENTTMSNISNKTKDENCPIPPSSSKSSSTFAQILPANESNDLTNHFQICSSGGVITVKKCSTDSGIMNKELVPKPTSPPPIASVQKDTVEVKESQAVNALKLPKIASCFSLNVKANIPKPLPKVALNDDQCLDFSSATSVNSAAFSHNKSETAKNSPNALSTENFAAKDPTTFTALDINSECIKDVYNSVIKTMNSFVSKKMQDIDCALKRESHIIPTPNADILCIMKWCNFLDAFCEGFAFVWQVKMKSASFFVVSIQNIMPMIIGAMGIVNITALKADKLPLLGRMLLQRLRNTATEMLAVVMQGKQSHWVVKGFLKADPSTACNKPTPESHPSLTKKINILCSLLVKQRQKNQKKKEKLVNNITTNQVPAHSATPTPTPAPTPPPPPPAPAPQVTQSPTTPKIAQILPTRRIVTQKPRPIPKKQSVPAAMQLPPLVAQHTSAQPITKQSDTQKTLEENNLDYGKVVAKQNSRKRKVDIEQSSNLLKTDKYNKMSSNIDFRSVTQNDVDEIFLPEMHKLDHKWLVLDLHNDFSHIFVPEFRDLVSLDRIQKVINFARQKSKIVKLQFFQNAPFDAFVTPKSIRKIYFGPLTMDMKGPTLILLQSVDGQMMLRELYQLQHQINKIPEETTKAFWLVHLKGQTHFEMDVQLSTAKETTQSCFPKNSLTTPDTTITNPVTVDSFSNIVNEEKANNTIEINDSTDYDEDCVIIDDEPESSSSRDSVAANILPQLNSLTAIQQSSKDPNLSIVETQKHPSTLQSLLKISNTSTAIKPISCSNSATPVLVNMPSLPPSNKPLSLLTLPASTIITGINPSCTSPLTNMTPSKIVNISNTARISNIERAPPEAPYSSTIFLTTSPSLATSVSSTTASAKTVGSTTLTTSTAFETKRIQSSEVGSAAMKQSNKIIRQDLEAGPIKRRRISIFCPNKYDKMSEKLAVDAVLKKMLPENAEDIHIGAVNERSNVPATSVPKVVATVGSTQISKIPSYPERNSLQKSSVTFIKKVKPTTTKAPIVFDVNFMDDGDEPTSSIIIKPTPSSVTSSTTTTVATVPPTRKSSITATNASIQKTPLTSPASVSATNSHIPSPTGFCGTAVPQNKNITLPTVSNNITKIKNSGNVTISTKGKVINSILCSKTGSIVPQFSIPKPIAPKIIPISSITNVSTSSTNHTSIPKPIAPQNTPISNITNVCTSSTNHTPTIPAIPFTFGRTSVTLKVQKIVKPLTAATAATTTTTSFSTNRPITTTTLTVQQVQDMLNKSNKSFTTNNAITPFLPSVCTLPATMPIQVIPSIKATITPAKASTVSATIAKTTTSDTTTTQSTDCIVKTTPSTVAPICTPAIATTALNPTLTISKVQSFGLPQKPPNSEKNLQTLITPPPAPIIQSDLNEKVLTSTPTPPPPPHVQYGYIVSNDYANQKFVAKRVAEEFYVKVPSIGILKLQGLASVNNYLNKYMSKILKETVTVVWQFVAASKAVQAQNHQKSLLVRKTKNNNITSGTSKNINCNSNSSLDEPILIDD